jgi:hypothetical protein
MKKSYIAPQTEAIELLADTVLMASPGGSTGTYISTNETAVGASFYGD